MFARVALLLVVANAVLAQEEILPPETPLRNVELVDREGTRTSLSGFYRLSGEDLFRGFLGAGEIDIPYERIVEIRVLPPEQPSGRMRAELALRTGKVVEANFDEREGEQAFSGYAIFGRVTIFFRDIRRLRFLGPTAREDLPDYGPPAAAGHDVTVTDRGGLATELTGFRRAVGEDVVPGVLGAATIAIPLRIVRRLEIAEEKGHPSLRAAAALRDGSTLDFRLPPYVEETAYRGEAEFGAYRIRLGKLRDLVVHRPTAELPEIEAPSAATGAGARGAGRPVR